MQEQKRITIQYKLFIESKLQGYRQLFSESQPMPSVRKIELDYLEKLLREDFNHPLELRDIVNDFQQKISKPRLVKLFGFLNNSRLAKVIDEILNEPEYSKRKLKIAYLYEIDEIARNSWETHPEAKRLQDENQHLKQRLTILEQELMNERQITEGLKKHMQEQNSMKSNADWPQPEISAYQLKITELEQQLASSTLQVNLLESHLADAQLTQQKLRDNNSLLAKRNNELVSENRTLKQKLHNTPEQKNYSNYKKPSYV